VDQSLEWQQLIMYFWHNNIISFGKPCVSVQVNRKEVQKAETLLAGEVYSKWEESYEISRTTKIRIDKKQEYLDHLQKTHHGKSLISHF